MAGNTKNITVRDIAERAGVSVSTVSRVMAGPEKSAPISEATRKRVMAVCEELKFLPDVHYSRLQERRSYVVALLVPRLGSSKNPVPFFSDENIGLFMTTLENVLSEAGYSILIQGVTPEYESSGKAVRILRNNTADGLLIWDAFQDPDTINALNEEHRPAICVAFPYESAESFIVPDNEGGAFQMARHLLDLGHRKIAYFSGGMGELVDRHREDGCRKALAEAGVEPVVLTGYYTHSGGRECMEAILRDHPDITAIFAANDLMALGAMDVAMDAGKRVPEDLSIAGFDGSSHAMISRPRLTTGKLPMAEIGRLAGEHTLRMAEEDRPEPLSLTLPIEIIPGGSTAKLRRG